MIPLKPEVSIIAFKRESADRFAVLASTLKCCGHTVQVYASDSVIEAFSNGKVKVYVPFILNRLTQKTRLLLAELIIKSASAAPLIIMDIGSTFNDALHYALRKRMSHPYKIVYSNLCEFYFTHTTLSTINFAQKILCNKNI